MSVVRWWGGSVRISSSVDAAQEAISGFSGVRVEAPGQPTNTGSSNIGSLESGAAVANHLLIALSGLVSSLQSHAERVTDLAPALEQRDSQDAGTWTWEE
ncbi:hypothetical protein [Leifsonia shinshuensis]|uniref:Uncharacterized protein n=1 Tax=Leifsonia shinshuensis TaxID=150026 RepID=A0A7G6YAF2_9MICO|nr:hypothetical protein [Leifsonia shinshuensis]QNE35467.1 hypothetical protein F1C12_10245 [Leifsonia shinshuensis]